MLKRVNKNILYTFLGMLVLISSICGCSSKSKDTKEKNTNTFNDGKYINMSFPQDVANGLAYDVRSEDEIKNEWEKKGCVVDKVSKEADGSIIVRVEKKDVEKAQESIKTEFEQGVTELLALSHNGAPLFSAIESMKASEDFQKCTVLNKLDAEDINDNTLATFFFKTAAKYNALSGDTYKEVVCDFVNNKSNSIIHSISSKTLWGK